jgi:hypothetical protein
VVRIKTGEQVALTAGASEPASNPDPTDPTALLLGNAERADVIVDFSGLPNGTVVRMMNTGPDAPFAGFPADPVADLGTTGQVMQFVVNKNLTGAKGSTDYRTTAPANLNLNEEQPLGLPTVTRLVSLNEESSRQVCVQVDGDGNFVVVSGNLVPIAIPLGPNFEAACITFGGAPFGPTAALVGTVSGAGTAALGNPLRWTDETGASQPVPVRLNNGTPKNGRSTTSRLMATRSTCIWCDLKWSAGPTSTERQASTAPNSHVKMVIKTRSSPTRKRSRP